MLIKGHTDFFKFRAGVVAGARLGIHLSIDTDVSRLFPHINGTFTGALYHDKPHYIQFNFDGCK